MMDRCGLQLKHHLKFGIGRSDVEAKFSSICRKAGPKISNKSFDLRPLNENDLISFLFLFFSLFFSSFFFN